MLQTSSIILTIWCGLNFILAAIILIWVLFLKKDAPILIMVFEKPEILKLDSRVITVVNVLAILYNSCAVAISILAMFIIWSSLINSQNWAFWALLVTIGFTQILGFIAFIPIGNQRWQVNVVLSALYIVGIGLAGYSIYS